MQKNYFRQLLSRYSHKTEIISFLIFFIALIAFSVKTLSTGLFHDDWHHVYYAYNFGLDGLRHFLFFDSRPLAYIVYGPLFSLLGVEPFRWHILVLLLRFLTVTVFFFSFNLVWPTYKKQNGLIALLFLIYPAFQAQPNSVSYALHWVTYFVFMLSMFFMILAIRKPQYRFWFTLIALSLEAFHLLMIEYFAGIELIRIFLLWHLVNDASFNGFARFKKIVKVWTPYLLILIAYAIFRVSYSALLGYDRNTPVVLIGLLTTPLDSVKFLLQAAVRDLVDVLFTIWNDTYDPALINFSVFTNLWVWGLAGIVGIGGWVFYFFLTENQQDETDLRRWSLNISLMGFVFVLLSFLPTWISGRTFFDVIDLYDDRFALPALFGASMIWIGGLFYLVKKREHVYVISFVLIGLAVGLQLRTNIDYSRAWEKQLNFYWQLYWRAPYIEPNTAFISDGEIFPYMGTHPTVYAINTLYNQNDDLQTLNYSFFPSGKKIGTWDEFRDGTGLEDDRFGSIFYGTSHNSLSIYYLPEENQCLWILEPEDKRIRSLPSITYEGLPVSNLNRIKRTPISSAPPPIEIFGIEPAHTWCYFYEKAALAQQYGDWNEVVKLWKAAEAEGDLPGNGVEYMVFVSGFAQTDQWTQASELTVKANKLGNNVRPALCELWSDLRLSTPSSSEKETAERTVSNKLNCIFE